MRILFLSNFYPPYERGGYEQLCHEVADGLKNKGHQIAVLTSNYQVNGSLLHEDAIYRCLNHEVDLRPFRATVGFVNRKRRLQETMSRFQEITHDFRPDVLFVWSMWNLPRELLALAESWKTPKTVYYLADYWPTLPDAYTLHWREPAQRWYTALPKSLLGRIALAMQPPSNHAQHLRFEHALCVSHAVRHRLLEAGLPFDRAQVVYNGIDLTPFLNKRKAQHKRDQIKPLSLLYAGRLAPEKGVHTVIEAVGLLTEQGHAVTLTIVGSGSPGYESELQALCQRLNVSDRVTFYGQVPRDQMPEVMARFEVLVFASVWPEPLARIVQEAMAIGLTVVGTDVGGMPEILSDGVNGLIFPPEDTRALARQIERLIVDVDLHQKLTTAGQRVVKEKFNIHRMLDEIEDYLEKVITASS